MRLATTLILVSALGLIAADPPAKDDAEALKGNWSGISLTTGGRSAPEDLITKFRSSFDGKNYTNSADGQVVEQGGYTLDVSKTPKAIDFDIKKGEGAGKKQLAIFQIEGDKLTLVVAEPGSADRPKSIKPEKSDPVIAVVMKRTKP